MISNEFIRQATEEYHEEFMSAIPTENEIDHVFSDRFEKNMESVIKKNKHPQLKRVLRMAASFALVILISGGSMMALSPTARAAVMGWLFGREAEAYVYRSTGTDTNSNTITTYDFAKIPEGYTLWQNMVMPNTCLVIYAEDETGRFLRGSLSAGYSKPSVSHCGKPILIGEWKYTCKRFSPSRSTSFTGSS